MQARRERFPDALLLKDGPPIPAFDLPNSPGVIAWADLSGRTVIQATGNGTRGVHLVSAAPIALCASFVNAAATARTMRAIDGRVLLVPTEGDEDEALADYLIALLRGHRVDPSPYLDRVGRSAAGLDASNEAPTPTTRAWPPMICRAVSIWTPSSTRSRRFRRGNSSSSTGCRCTSRLDVEPT